MNRAEIVERDTKKKEFETTERFSTGSTLVDLVHGGGWVLGRVFNIVGDKSSGKTLFAIEGFANFARKYPKGRMRYAEAEAAFDVQFAKTLGFPVNVERPEKQLHTVEEFRDDLNEFIKAGGPSMYVLDSLDALSDDAEVTRFEKGEADKGTFGVAKAKKMSELFRLLTQDTQKADCTLLVISQIRDKIGVQFGETKSRSGGHALDFYCSGVTWLIELGKLSRTVKGVDRPIGIDALAKNKKLKVGMPYREAEFQIVFGYGVDDEISNLNWLKSVKSIPDEVFKDIKKKIEAAREKQDYVYLDQINAQLKLDVTNIWNEIEKALAPTTMKYR